MRRLSTAEKIRIQELGEQGVAPKQIVSVIRCEFGNNSSTNRDISNVLHSAKMAYLGGRSPMEALIDLISIPDYESHFRIVDDVIVGVYFMHKDSVGLCKAYGTVFLMDCTYKTNKFQMPLLNIVGIASTYQTFNAGFVFLNEENEESYTWALEKFSRVISPAIICTDRELALMNSVSVVFPNCKNILCIWHINKNVLANCKKYFNVEESWNLFISEWNSLVQSVSLEDYERKLTQFEQTYYATYPAIREYMHKTWMPHKEKFIHCFINIFPHFGSSSTSRVEGNHHVIKSYVRLEKLNLLMVFNRLTHMLTNQKLELNAEMERQKLISSHHLRDNIFKELHYHVSLFALEKMYEQLILLEGESNESVCTGLFTKTWGLPCKHTILRCVEVEKPISLSTIHNQWLLDPNPLSSNESLSHEDISMSPRARFMEDMGRQLYTSNDKANSILIRLNHVIDTPHVVLQGPNTVTKKRGRPAGVKNKTSMTRDRSLFEYAQGRKCRTCGNPGHN